MEEVLVTLHNLKKYWMHYQLMMFVSARAMLERMGKTMFFRSGDHPRVLTEEQREERKQGKYNEEPNVIN